jgi:hypothetical protein
VVTFHFKPKLTNILLFLLTVLFPTALFFLYIRFSENSPVLNSFTDPRNGPFWAIKLPALALLVYYSLLFFWYSRLGNLTKASTLKISFILSGLIQGFVVSTVVALHIGLQRIFAVLIGPFQILLIYPSAFLGTLIACVVLGFFIFPPFLISFVFLKQMFLLLSHTEMTKKEMVKLVPFTLLFLVIGFCLQLAVLAIMGIYPNDLVLLFTNSCNFLFSQYTCFTR